MNKSSFTIRMIEGISSFTLSVFDFAVTTTLLARVKIKIKFIANLIASVLLITTIRIKRIKIVVSATKLIYSNIPTINIKGIKVTGISKLSGKVSATVKNLLKVTGTSRMIERASTTLSLKFLRIVGTLSLGHFIQLLTHDPSLLSAVDGQTLEDLDFIAT